MDDNVLKKWFISILPRLENNSVIVIDNGPYHFVKVERIHTKSWMKTDIQIGLDIKGDTYKSNCLKRDLLAAIPQHICAACNKYHIDQATDCHPTVVP
jgi:hypothetical protein